MSDSMFLPSGDAAPGSFAWHGERAEARLFSAMSGTTAAEAADTARSGRPYRRFADRIATALCRQAMRWALKASGSRPPTR